LIDMRPEPLSIKEGGCMQTEKDAGIVDWIGRLGAAGAQHIQGRFHMGRSWAYARLNRLANDGLLEQHQLLYRQPGLYVATAEGLRWRGLQRLGVHHVTPGGFEHAWQVATVAVAFHHGLPGWTQLSDREIRDLEVGRGELVASARVGELPGGRPAVHRSDLALMSNDGGVVAVEVELSVKAARRLQAICRAYARARHINHVYYLAAPAAAKAVSRAVEQTRAQDRITVLPLDDVGRLVAAETGEASDGRV
jgi:hypothetical protein